MSETFLKEIKSEARSDAITNFIVNHKKKFITAGIGAIALLLIFFIFSIFQSNLEEKYSKILHQSLIDQELGNIKKTKSALKEIHDATFAPRGVKALASIRYGGLILLEGKKDEALKIYKEVAFSSLNDDFLQEFAGLLATKIIVEKTDKNSQKKSLALLKKIVRNNKILKNLTKEQLAIYYIKINENKQARKILEEIIKAPKLSKTLKKRASDMIKLIS